MIASPRKSLLRAGVAFAICACVAACAVPGSSRTSAETARPLPAGIILAQDAQRAVIIGKSTKADVIAALGETTVIRFDSGSEVWVYHVDDGEPASKSWMERIGLAGPKRATRGRTEFVVVFAPSGVVTKTRTRPPPRASIE